MGDLPKTFYVEGVSGSASFKDVELRATYSEEADVADKAKVTVFEVTLTGIFSGAQQDDNGARFIAVGGSSDRDGKISWDDANGDGNKDDPDTSCEYFHNCMEVQGCVQPAGVEDEVEFAFQQYKMGTLWSKVVGHNWVTEEEYASWDADGPYPEGEDLSVSPAAFIYHDNIYTIDAPGWLSSTRPPDYIVQVGDFIVRSGITIGGVKYRCSDWYKWHSQIRIEPKNETQLTRDDPALQLLGSGWIVLPQSPE